MPDPKKKGQDAAIGRSTGEWSTKIHATTDALGKPTDFFLTPGQASDLKGADALLPGLKAKTLLLRTKRMTPMNGGLIPCNKPGRRRLFPPDPTE